MKTSAESFFPAETYGVSTATFLILINTQIKYQTHCCIFSFFYITKSKPQVISSLLASEIRAIDLIG